MSIVSDTHFGCQLNPESLTLDNRERPNMWLQRQGPGIVHSDFIFMYIVQYNAQQVAIHPQTIIVRRLLTRCLQVADGLQLGNVRSWRARVKDKIESAGRNTSICEHAPERAIPHLVHNLRDLQDGATVTCLKIPLSGLAERCFEAMAQRKEPDCLVNYCMHA